MRKIKNKIQLLNNSKYKKSTSIALDSVESALEAINPEKIIERKVLLQDNFLTIDNLSFDINSFNNIYVISVGKASILMYSGIQQILDSKINKGLIISPFSSDVTFKNAEIFISDHPIPSKKSILASNKIIELIKLATDRDLILFLISGGGSSLIALPDPNLTLNDKIIVNNLLLSSGANIRELNSVRKHLSQIKGGNLIKNSRNSTIISLIISDIVGDPVDCIASGITSPDYSTYQDAINVLTRYDLWDKIPLDAKKILTKGINGEIKETPKPFDPIFNKVHNIVIANPYTTCSEVVEYLKTKNINTKILTSKLEGDSSDMSLMFSLLCKSISENNLPLSKPCALIIAGEITVKVKGTGKGGRHQEAALVSSMKISGLRDIALVFIGTDGIDGFTDSAGSIIDGDTLINSEKMGIEAKTYLANNDSHSFFKETGGLIFTGFTGTNLCDLWLAIIL